MFYISSVLGFVVVVLIIFVHPPNSAVDGRDDDGLE